MTTEPIPLATQLAGLRAAAEAHTGRCWLTRALEAMIMAALARIFGRLEELVRLWQASLLPALPNPERPVCTASASTASASTASTTVIRPAPAPCRAAGRMAQRVPPTVRARQSPGAGRGLVTPRVPVIRVPAMPTDLRGTGTGTAPPASPFPAGVPPSQAGRFFKSAARGTCPSTSKMLR